MKRFFAVVCLISLVLAFLLPNLSFADKYSPEADLVKSLRHAAVLTKTVQASQQSGKNISFQLKNLQRLAEDIRSAHLLLQERHRLSAQKAATLGGKAQQRQAEMSRRYQEVFDRLLPLLEKISSGTTSSSSLDDLVKLLEEIAPAKKAPILGSLPYRTLGYPAKQPTLTPVIVPAYRNTAGGVIVPEDLKGAGETAVTPEIAALAESLNWNPAAIYAWVKNNIDTEWYWGVMKGAAETLRQGSGNDADQAALLVSLLRSANYPARFVRGVIEFYPQDLARLTNLTGVQDPQKIAEVFQRAGIPFAPVMSGLSVANYQVAHVWVEAQVPYANYRGVLSDAQGKIWVGLDTSIKVAGYSRTAPAVDLYGSPGNPLPSLRDDYLATFQLQSPLASLQAEAQSFLDQNHPGLLYADVLSQISLRPESLKILPSTLQFKEIAVTGEHAQLPDELKHKVRLVAETNEGLPIFDLSLDASALSNQKVHLGYEPETVEDQEIINGWGGLDNTPAYLVRVRPVLLVNDERVVVGKEGLPVGAEFRLTLELRSPNGVETLANAPMAGYPQALGIVAQQAIAPATEGSSQRADDLLFREAINYVGAWNQAEEELSSLLQVAVVRPIPTVVTMGGVVEVPTLLGQPQSVSWKGLFLDADLRAAGVVSQVLATDDRERRFLELSALQGSVLESKVFEDAFEVESVSTAKIFGWANDSLNPILSVDATTVDSLLPTLAAADNVKADIAAAVAEELTVRIPQNEVVYGAWSGTGYIKENLATGEAGYMLSGLIAGGMTAVSPTAWPAALVYAFESPFSEEPNLDPAAATTLHKLSSTDFQEGTAGVGVPQPLSVLVRDADGRPVQGTEVTFTVVSGGGAFQEGNQAPLTSVTVTTNARGVATAQPGFVPGKYTATNPVSYFKSGDRYATIAGENTVAAQLATTGAQLAQPFVAYGLPGPPAKIVRQNNGTNGHILNYSGAIALGLYDQFDNPVANAAVDFQALAPGQKALSCPTPDPAPADLMPQITTERSCMDLLPGYGECPATAAAASVRGYTLSDGVVMAGIILGSLPNASYPITAAYSDPSGAVTLPTVSFESWSKPLIASATEFNECGGKIPPHNRLILSVGNVAARPANVPTSLRAKAFLVGEGETLGQQLLSCSPSNQSCDQIVGNRQFTSTQPADLALTVNGKPAALLPEAGTGVYEGQMTLSVGLNDVVLRATASKEVSEYPNDCSGCASQAQLKSRDLTAEGSLQVYGVAIQMPAMVPVQIDAGGFAVQDTSVNYSILPAEYAAASAQFLIWENGKLVAAMPSGVTGENSVAIPQGFWFNPAKSYEVQILLDYTWETEIWSEKVPIGFGTLGGTLRVDRLHLVSQFDTTVPATIGSAYVDTYRMIPFAVAEASTVSATLLNESMQEVATLVPAAELAAGNHNFVVDFDQVRGAGFNIVTSPRYFVRLRQIAVASGAVQTTLFPGSLTERANTAKILGQTIVHDVLLQDGSLNLSRTDVELKGRGPQLSFNRSYSNQNSRLGFNPLGKGWGHSLDLRLRLLNHDTGNGPVPDWVAGVKGSFFPDSAIPQTPLVWNTVQVNGTLFKRHNGVWYAERGRHGTLENIAGGFAYTAKDGTRYTYDQVGGERELLASRIEDRNANVLSFAYDAYRRLETVSDAVGRQLTFAYQNLAIPDENPARLASVAGPDGIVLTFTYDDNGYLQSSQRGSRVENYAYQRETGISGGEFNLVRVTDANNHSYSYGYHGPGEVSPNLANFTKVLKSQDVVKQVVYPDGHAAGFQYDVATANKRLVTDLRGNLATYTLNYLGNPLQIEEPLGKITQMTWSIDEGKPDNVMTSKTVTAGVPGAVRNLTTTYEYDAKGNVTRETDPYNNSIATVWNQTFSLPTSRTDRNGVVQTWDYDPANGNLNWQQDGDGHRTSYSYYPTGEVQTVTDARLNVTSFTYDAYGNPDTVTGPEASVTDFDYDVRGRKGAETDPNGNRTVYAYNELDYPQSITYPALTSYTLPSGSSNVSTFDYDALGNLLSETDRVGLTLTYTYTSRNQVETITRGGAAGQFGKKIFRYDENGNLTSETDWKSVASTHTYDELNRRVGTTNRLGDAMAMAYDLAGNLIQTTDFEGRVTDFEFDDLNRQTRIIAPQLPGQAVRGEVVKTYYNEADPAANLKTVTDAEGHLTTFEYNGRYQKTKRINALLDEFVWQYDPAGNLEKEIDEEGNETRYVYDKQNRRTLAYKALKDASGVIAREIPIEERQYDAAGNVRFVVDANGHATESTYDQWNRPYQVTTPADPVAYTTSTERDGEGREVKIIDGNGHGRTFLRDLRGLVLTATDAELQPTTYTYDLNDNVATVTNARGFVTRIGYDAEDRRLLTTEAEGTAEQRITGVVEYDKVGNPLQVRDGNGNIFVTTYNGLNLPWKQYDPAPFNANLVETLYDKNGKPVSSKNRRGHIITTSYDALGRVDTVTDPAPFNTQTIVTTYDNVGNVRTVTDKRDIVSETIYDDLYRVTEQRRDGIRLVSNEYDDAGNLTATVDAENNRTEYLHSPRNLLTTTTYIDGVNDYTELRSYDGVGNLLTLTNEDSEGTTYTYDKENRQKTVEFAGETTENFYDGVGNLTRVLKPKGNDKPMAYDGLNRLASVTEGGLLSTSYTYDANNNQLTQTDPRRNLVEFTYDALNRKTQHIQHKASGNLTVNYDQYDAEGNLTRMTDAMGRQFTYVYDELNRLTTSTYPVVTTSFMTIENVVTGYDANNNVTSVTETKQIAGGGTQTDTTVNTYDNFDRLETSDQRGTVVTYGYDNNGNRISVSAPGGSTTNTYDHRNRLATAAVGADTTIYSYTPEGLTETISYPNGTSATYTYFPTNRVETITHKDALDATISSYSYLYDTNGNRTQQVELQGGVSETTDYVYDGLDRLENFTLTSGATTTVTGYTFEGYNRKTETVTVNGVPTVDKTYSYDETNWLTQVADSLASNTITYSYDDNGNTALKADSSKPDEDLVFEYDVANRLVMTTQGVTSLGKYDYNAQGMRIRHYGSERGNVEYIYDDGAVLEEYSGTLLAHYRYGDRLLSLNAPSDGGIQYYHHDALGSTVNLTDSVGATKVSYSLDPWGHIRNQVGSSVNRQIFTGQEHDQQTGLIYFGARYYDPDTARFISQDSYLGQPGTPPSLSRYLYSYSNPMIYVDLDGYESVEVDNENNVYWNVERISLLDDNSSDFEFDLPRKTTRRVRVGQKSGDKVQLTVEFGGGVVAHQKLAKAAAYFWNRGRIDSVMDQADISDYNAEYQDQLIANYIDSELNPRGEERLSIAPSEGLFEEHKADLRAIATGQPQNKSHDGQSPRLNAFGNLGRSLTEEILLGASGEKLAAVGAGILKRSFVSAGRGLYPVRTPSGIRWKDPLTGRFVQKPSSGKIVLGHYDPAGQKGYVEVAKKLQADFYQVPGAVWNKLTKKEAWDMNKLFIDEALDRGDKIILGTTLRPGKNYFARELRYLREKGVDLSTLQVDLIK